MVGAVIALAVLAEMGEVSQDVTPEKCHFSKMTNQHTRGVNCKGGFSGGSRILVRGTNGVDPREPEPKLCSKQGFSLKLA